jgi:predicted NBD/HSP70 family sugar kinase
MLTQAGATQDEIRRRNVSTLLRHLHVHGPLSRAALTSLMGLNRSTIKALVDDLGDAGLVTETIPETRLGAGRPSHVVAPRHDTAYVLAANIGVDTVAVAAVGLGGIVLSRHEYRLPGTGVRPTTVADRLAKEFHKLRDQLAPTAWLAGVGIGVPGLVRTGDGDLEFAPNLGWRDVPFGRLMDERLGVQMPVRMGGGIIVDGRIVSGAQGYAGELGHMIVNSQGRSCRCGSRGCFETEIGEDAVLVACGREAGAGRGALTEVFTAAHAGEARELEGLGAIASWVGRGLVTLVNIFNPELVILGGPLLPLVDLTGDVIRSEIAVSSMFGRRREFRLEPAGLGQDSSLLGAAEMAFDELLLDPVDVRFRSTRNAG